MYEVTEDQEALGVIARLDERINLEQTDVDGKRKTTIHKGYASGHLYGIEKFVQKIEEGWEGGFVEVRTRYSGMTRIRELYLGKNFYRLMNDWLERYSDIHRYSARVEAFYEACKELGLIGRGIFSFGQPGDVASADGTLYLDVFNRLIEVIRARCKTRDYKERERLRLVNANKNVQNVLAAEEAMFCDETGRSRWLVLSATLGYKAKYRRWITIDDVQRHRDRFFKARRFNKLMSGIKWFVWAIEQGEGTGLHLHVIMFYSAESNRDEYITKQIGEYWVDAVTEGKGEYWNSNAGWLKKLYEKKHGVGVGQINRNDVKKRRALRINLAYLAKAVQYLLIKGAEHMHLFGMGKLPEKTRAGRPRVEADVNNTGGRSVDVEPFDEAGGDR
ncbi:hypothetical protein [Ralstonia pseudosolanacearum]|uniref:hypothetical protein n=1 Tax=Ralstonia pseudosolanacearum TaxID=1310165 RepID=UPI0026754586|nr:hypothetical protein [Ralstonia pseudosolanacearum]MDO3560723.1 hypothetical protein [Ralstonia pseudosolanacearum]MDO3570058.1 hypothetical protein [Ralstonia pseudosolanacearum]